MDSGCSPGGILRVLELIADNKAAIVYDFRHRFNLSIHEFGKSVGWDEVVSLVSILLVDPTSWTQAAVAKWKHPISYEWTLLASTYDLHAAVNSKTTPKPWPRPWDDVDKKTEVRKDARAILKKAKEGILSWQNKPTPM